MKFFSQLYWSWASLAHMHIKIAVIVSIVFIQILLPGCATRPVKDSYLDKTIQVVKFQDEHVARFVASAEKAAEQLIKGGKLYVAGEPGPVGELTYRSGGPMMARRLYMEKVTPDDVVLYFPDAAFEKRRVEWQKRNALIITIDQKSDKESPIHPAHEKIISGNIFISELISALTRKGKMPVLFETIGRYNGHPRIRKYRVGRIPFHKKHSVKPIPPTELAHGFTKELLRLLDQGRIKWSEKIGRARFWIQDTNTKNGKIYLYYTGHFYPDFFKKAAPKGWILDSLMAGLTGNKVPDHDYKKEDLIIYIGAHHPPLEILPKIKKAGAKIVYVSLHSHRDYNDFDSFLWIDPLWPWNEAVVKIPGYDIPAIPASGILNAALFMEMASAGPIDDTETLR